MQAFICTNIYINTPSEQNGNFANLTRGEMSVLTCQEFNDTSKGVCLFRLQTCAAEEITNMLFLLLLC